MCDDDMDTLGLGISNQDLSSRIYTSALGSNNWFNQLNTQTAKDLKRKVKRHCFFLK